MVCSLLGIPSISSEMLPFQIQDSALDTHALSLTTRTLFFAEHLARLHKKGSWWKASGH